MPDILESIPRTVCEHDLENWVKPKKIQAEWRLHKTPRTNLLFVVQPCRRYQTLAYSVADSLPRQLRQITTIIEQSRFILDIVPCEDNGQYDCNEQTWIRATEFLTKNAKWVWDIHSHVIDTPHILPGPENSIDLHWDYSGYELLINIPADPAEMAGFYGDDHGVISIKGKFDPNKINHGLLLWLAEER